MSGSTAQGIQPKAGGYVGAEGLLTAGSLTNTIDFVARRVLAEKAFTAMVKVLSCSNAGGVAPIGTVTVQPMVHQADGLGNLTPHGAIYNLPYARVQGGANAVVIDPVAGDIGVAVFCDRDTSTVRASGAPAGPASGQKNGWGDGLYLFTVMAAIPTTYIMLNGGNVSIVTPGNLTITAANATLTAAGNLRVSGQVTAGGTNNTLGTHTHSGGAAPTPGT